MNATKRYDVVIMGGAIAGASTAILLRRFMPGLSVLVVEKGTEFDWKVGESTVEVSAYFLTRVLRLYDYLSRNHLAKQGFRYWFHRGSVTSLREASEVGPTQLARTPSFQIDRAHLDEHILSVAREEGAEVWRPARVVDFKLKDETGADDSALTVEKDGERFEITAGWVVDATGRAASIGRKKGIARPVQDHQTASIWARFKNVKDLDGKEIGGIDPSDPFVRRVVASRRLGTNHFVGFGYWIWFIPLRGGETSVGLVWDKRLVEPQGANAEEKLTRFLSMNPLTNQLLEGAEIVPGDTRMYGHLPYFLDKVCGDGWSTVGDASGFLDPFYSPGLDQMTFSVSWTLELLKRKSMMEREPFLKELEMHNMRYGRFFKYFFGAIYQDKYYLMGDYDTMSASFLMDTALYYAVAVKPIYTWSADRVLVPPYYQDYSEIGYYPMRFYQQRLISIAKRKLALGIYGNHNAGRCPGFVGFSLRSSAWVMFGHGVLRWLKAELANAWTYISRPKPMPDGMPIAPAPTNARSVPNLNPEPVSVNAG